MSSLRDRLVRGRLLMNCLMGATMTISNPLKDTVLVMVYNGIPRRHCYGKTVFCWPRIPIINHVCHVQKSALESSVAETEGRYCAQLSQIQEVIANVQCELQDIRNQLELQSSEYKMLLDVKTRLEQEIGKYRELLDGGDSK